jgi:hypothetical protein
MDPEVVSRRIRLHVGHAVGSLRRSNSRAAAIERRKLKIGSAIAANRVRA